MGNTCRGCIYEIVTQPWKKPEKPSAQRHSGALVYHGGLPIVDEPDAGLPGYCGIVTEDIFEFGALSLKIEAWPNFRIGGSLWPSGLLLAHALVEASGKGNQIVDATGKLAELPMVKGRRCAEIGAGIGLPGLIAAKLGTASMVVTDRSELVPLLERNIQLNDLSDNCTAEALDWSVVESSTLFSAAGQGSATPLDVILAADVIYYEEQDPLAQALQALMTPGHTELVLAYRERTPADRGYLQDRLLPRLDNARRVDFAAGVNGNCEIYIGRLRA